MVYSNELCFQWARETSFEDFFNFASCCNRNKNDTTGVLFISCRLSNLQLRKKHNFKTSVKMPLISAPLPSAFCSTNLLTGF